MERPSWNPTDAELALRVADGQESAFEDLLARHSDLLRYQAGAFYAPGETYDDLLQSARLALYRAACTFDPSRGGKFRSFASLAIRAELITALKSATRRKHEPLNAARSFEQVIGDSGLTLADVVPAPGREQPEERALAREQLARITGVLNSSRLSETERIVIGRRLRGLSLTECGRGLGTAADPGKTADNALQRVKRKLAA